MSINDQSVKAFGINLIEIFSARSNKCDNLIKGDEDFATDRVTTILLHFTC